MRTDLEDLGQIAVVELAVPDRRPIDVLSTVQT